MENVHRLKSAVNQLQGQKLRIDGEVQQRQKLEKNREQLQDRNDILSVEIQVTMHSELASY